MNPKKGQVLIFDLKGNLSSTKIDARNRHAIYARFLNQMGESESLGLSVFTKGVFSEKVNLDGVAITQFKLPKFNVFKFISLSLNEMEKSNLEIKVLVCSDPWETFFAGWLLKKLSRSNFKIEVQVHADISETKWKGLNLKNLLRSTVHGFSFKHADQIRVVSPEMREFVMSRYGTLSSKIVTVPLPVLFASKDVARKRERIDQQFAIGFIGRMHKDRGTDLLIELIELLNKNRSDFFVVVAGQGPQEMFVIEKLSACLGVERVKFLGLQAKDDLVHTLSSLDVYLSLAPSESYGLGIREAIGYGVPVVALTSNGSRGALLEYGDERIRLFKEQGDYSEFIHLIEWAFKSGAKENLTVQINLKSEIHMRELVHSWQILAKV